MKLLTFSAFCILIVLTAGASASFAQKLTAEDVLAKHLDSIGSMKNRDLVKTRIVVSDVEFLLQSQNPIRGKSVIASSTEAAIFGINLDANNYRLDKFSFDGKKTHVGYITPGVRSILGGFIFSYQDVLKEGLLGGTLSASWALLKTENRRFRLSYEGTKKIDKKETYVIEYSPKNGSDLNIKMYFDQENFRHLRTEYSRVIAAQIGATVDSSPRQVDARYRLTEDFSDFKKFGELILPGFYKINYTSGGGGAVAVKADWKFKVTDASVNQPLGDNAFDIEAN